MQVKEQDVLSVCGVEKAEGGDSVRRNFAGTTSFFKTTFNGLNTLAGAGIMSISYALSSGGWLSLILLLAIASVTFYTGLLIKRCMEVDQNIRSYPDIGDKAFGAKGRILISILINLELYLIATGFLILAGDNLHKLLPYLFIHGIPIGGRQSFDLLIALTVLPTIWIDKMSTLSYISTTGVVASMVILGSVLWSGIFDGIWFHQKGSALELEWATYSLQLIYSLLSCSFSFPYILHFNAKSRTILLGSDRLLSVQYNHLHINGSYGIPNVRFRSTISDNIKPPTNSFSPKVAIFTALINPITKYPLLLKPIVDVIESCFESYFKRRDCLLIRTTLVGISVVVALTLPFFGDLISLVGAFLSVTVSILLPCLCYLKIFRAYRKIGFEMSMGLIVLVSGTYISLLQIIQNL